MGGSLFFGGGINPRGLAGQCFLAVDRSGGPTNDNIYMLASVEPFGGGGTDVMFARSTNGGQSFSGPQRINDDPINPNKWHWFGTLAVAPSTLMAFAELLRRDGTLMKAFPDRY